MKEKNIIEERLEIEDILHKAKKRASLSANVTSIAELIGDLKKTIPTAVNDDYKTFYEKYFQLITDRTNQIAQRIDEID
tara:strand:- start:1398 stop:1634 length:237 start_codon:yes stop_codon:yes gene_type:complete